jgi:uncharacterized protein (TIGR03086 family)
MIIGRAAGPVALLGRAVDYAFGSLLLVTATDLPRATPCTRWDVEALLQHMNDSLLALCEAIGAGTVDLTVAPPVGTAADLVETLRTNGCRLRKVCAIGEFPATSTIGDVALDMDTVAEAGAVEITVHGWDVARGCGVDRPIPEPLAQALLGVAGSVATDEDRPHRFAAPLSLGPSAALRLLGHLGRNGAPQG